MTIVNSFETLCVALSSKDYALIHAASLKKFAFIPEPGKNHGNAEGICGNVVGIEREDGSGKTYIVTVITAVTGEKCRVFIRF